MKAMSIVGMVCLVLMATGAAWAQRITLQQVEIADGKITIRYDLEGSNSNQKFLINLFTSYDQFNKPLNYVTGDVGVDVSPGLDKKIVWDISKELGKYKGNLTFEVRGRVYVPFVRITQFEKGKVFRRGKSYPITWTSGNQSGNVDIEVFQEQERIFGDNNLPNNGNYNMFIPNSTKPGTYTIKFTNVKDRSDVVYSEPFSIKPKISTVVKMVGGVAVVGGLAVIIKGTLGGDGGGTTEKVLPSFPKDPDGN